MANFSVKEMEYVEDKMLESTGLRDPLRRDFEGNPYQVLNWLRSANKKWIKTFDPRENIDEPIL